MSAPPGAPDGTVLLDVTRTVSRVGRGAPTGVDRVERAYLDWALALPGRAVFLARVFAGYVLLDAAGMRAFLAGAPHGAADLRARLALRQDAGQRRAETALRRAAFAGARRGRLGALLRRHVAPGFHAFSVGHANQTARVYAALRAAGAATVSTLVHDVIPLDYPEYTRPGAVERFRAQLRLMAEGSDLLIYNSAHTAERSRHWLSGMGLAPADVVAHLGAGALPAAARVATGRPEFLILGTIEPRKNHLLLLALWRRFHETMAEGEIPHLHIVGRRGWENEQVIDALERAPFMGRTVFEHGFLDDAALAARLARTRALLFPSFAEGFGLPLLEALGAGLPVLAADIPPFREIAGGRLALLDPLDGPAWARAILDLSARPVSGTDATGGPPLPCWDAHFARVAAAIAARA